MKKFIHVLCIATVLIFLSLNVLNAETAEIDQVVILYFQALKGGDTDTVKSLIMGKLYEKRIYLLENNPDYSTFLKRYYLGMNVQIMNTFEEGEEAYVDVEIQSQDGSNTPIRLFLGKGSDNNWKISDEIESY